MQALYSRELNSQDIGSLMDFSWFDRESADRDSELLFSRLLLHGIIENLETIDASISKQLQHWEVPRMSKVDLAIMRMGVYELLFTPDTPRQIVINEAVEIAKEFGAQKTFSIINGVLDSIRP